MRSAPHRLGNGKRIAGRGSSQLPECVAHVNEDWECATR